jgi:hypothetical protein
MKYIITEEQLGRTEQYQIKWKKFDIFMKRRDAEIKELIREKSQRYKVNLSKLDEVTVIGVRHLVVAYFIDNNNISEDGDEFDWVMEYIKDNYNDYIRKELGL